MFSLLCSIMGWPASVPSWITHSFVPPSFIGYSLVLVYKCIPATVKCPGYEAPLHACDTHAQHSILVSCLWGLVFFSVDLKSVEEGSSWALLSALDIGASGTLFIPLGICFKAPQEEAAGQGCRPEASWGPGWWGVQLARVKQCSPLLLQVREAAKNGNFVGLISVPPVPAWVPSPHLLSQWFQRLIDWLIMIIFECIGFCPVSHLAKRLKMVSFQLHWLPAILRRGGFLPRTPDTVGWCHWILCLEFSWVGEWWHTHNETKQQKLKEPVYILPLKAKKNRSFTLNCFISLPSPPRGPSVSAQGAICSGRAQWKALSLQSVERIFP